MQGFQVISGISTTVLFLLGPVDWKHQIGVSLKIAGSKLQVDHDPNHEPWFGKPCETRLLLPRVFWVTWRQGVSIALGDVCNCESPETQRKIILCVGSTLKWNVVGCNGMMNDI